MRRRMRLGRRNMRTLCRRNSISHLRCTHNFEHLLAMRGLEEPAGRKLGRMERAGGVCVCGSEMGGHVSNQSFESGVHHALGACTACTFHHLGKKQKFRNVFATRSRTTIMVVFATTTQQPSTFTTAGVQLVLYYNLYLFLQLGIYLV